MEFMEIVAEIKENLKDCLDGKISLNEFQHWFIPVVWDLGDTLEKLEKMPVIVREFVYGIELLFAENSGGYMSKDNLLKYLKNYANIDIDNFNITILVEPQPKFPNQVGIDWHSSFAAEISKYTIRPVLIKEGFLRDAPDGYILFDRYKICKIEKEIASRIVLISASRINVLGELESNKMLGAITSLRMSEWKANPSSKSGFYGLSLFVDKIGATPGPAFLKSENYCHLDIKENDDCNGMPHLLVKYLVCHYTENWGR